MKNYLLFILFFLSFPLFAQQRQQQNLPNFENKLLHFGFTIGTNIMNFQITKADNFFSETEFNQIYSIESKSIAGFHFGPVADLHLGEYFDFRLLVDLSFGQRNLNYLMVKDTASANPSLNAHSMKIASTFIEFPLLLKYKSKRLNNFRVYLIGGINPRMDMASQKKINEEEMPKIRLQKFDIAYEIGTGIDFYLPYFKFSPELKYSRGLNNILKKDETQFTKAINKMNSNIWLLSFHFEGTF